MKELGHLSLLLLIAVASGNKEICEGQSSGTKFPHRLQCDKFYLCGENGEVFEIHCQEGLLYDFREGVCLPDKIAKCFTQILRSAKLEAADEIQGELKPSSPKPIYKPKEPKQNQDSQFEFDRGLDHEEIFTPEITTPELITTEEPPRISTIPSEFATDELQPTAEAGAPGVQPDKATTPQLVPEQPITKSPAFELDLSTTITPEQTTTGQLQTETPEKTTTSKLELSTRPPTVSDPGKQTEQPNLSATEDFESDSHTTPELETESVESTATETKLSESDSLTTLEPDREPKLPEHPTTSETDASESETSATAESEESTEAELQPEISEQPATSESDTSESEPSATAEPEESTEAELQPEISEQPATSESDTSESESGESMEAELQPEASEHPATSESNAFESQPSATTEPEETTEEDVQPKTPEPSTTLEPGQDWEQPTTTELQPETSEQPTTPNTEPSNPNSKHLPDCRYLPEGAMIADKADCNIFYHCRHGLAHRKRCSIGLHYNPTFQLCDWPQSAGCIVNDFKNAAKKFLPFYPFN